MKYFKGIFLKVYFLVFLLSIFNLNYAYSQSDLVTNYSNDLCLQEVDSSYGLKFQNHLIENLINFIDVQTCNGNLSLTKSFIIKRRINEISNVINHKIQFDSLKSIENINQKVNEILNELNQILMFDSIRSCEKEAILKIKEQIDSLAATVGNFDSCNGLSNEDLKEKLHKLISNHKSLGYNQARYVMFTNIDNHNHKVRCVYTGREISWNSGIPSANPPEAMNTEHTWPKSLGAANEPAKSDLHHLYPTDSFANSTRSSFPFGIVTNPIWSQGGSTFDGKKFMPREDHRGKVARAYFYFSVRYNLQIKDDEEKVLREWHKQYPVTDEERERNEQIFNYQANRNPFVDRPDFVDKISNF